jgi:nucleotidyltransferase substrate binding protein (TIGR01987 family)
MEMTKKYANFVKSHEALARTMKVLQDSDELSAQVEESVVAGLIKHFELTYETSWKFLQSYLYEVKGVAVSSAKTTFRACYEHKILPQNITDELVDLVDIRNETAHVYNNTAVQDVRNAIVKHYQVFNEIIKLGSVNQIQRKI